MTVNESLFLTFEILGGLALFLFGMQLMTDGLRTAAGDRLRVIIYRSTGNRLAGLGLGTGLGFLMHSSATSVMTVGFINAGLLSLTHSFPVFMGANVGTTLSMQLISFKLTDYALMAIAIGFLLSLAAPSPLARSIGRSILGFGLLFKGMDIMGSAIQPHRQTLIPWLAYIDGSTLKGMLLGTLVAWMFTAIIQSSGATIGMTFVLISAGVFTSLEQVYPIILGAHLGTTTTALIACLGCGIEGKRGAVSNFMFNVFNVALGLIAAPLFILSMEMTSGDVVRQAANLHTALMVVAAFILLPISPRVVDLVRAIMPSKQPLAEPSYLSPELIPLPENALTAVIRESRRNMDILTKNLNLTKAFVENPNLRTCPSEIRTNEQSVDEIRDATQAYLARLTERYLSRRQRLLAQYLSHITSDIERVGDYIMHIAEITEQQRRTKEVVYDEATHQGLLKLFAETERVLEVTRSSLDPDTATFPDAAHAIENARNAFSELSQSIRQSVNDRVAEHDLPAITGIFFSKYTLSFDSLVRHCRMIAREQQQPFFALKPAKLDRVEPPAAEKHGPPDKDKDKEKEKEKKG